MRISAKYKSTDYLKLNLIVNSSHDKWTIAVDIFRDRYFSRFIHPIKELANSQKKEVSKSSGFAIMALNSLLIETLIQFYYGSNDTEQLKRNKQIPHITSIEDAFIEFFSKSVVFSPWFKEQESRLYYKHIRCGLLHQAETKQSSEIHIKKSQTEVVRITLKGHSNEGISIRRDLFTDMLIQEFEDYQSLLLDLNNHELRSTFIAKMNHICDNQL